MLVIDDEPGIRDLLDTLLRRKGYDVIVAESGQKGLECFHRERPDVLVLDLKMPEMDGLTLLSRLSESSPLIKAVIVSAYGDMDNIRTAMNRGAFDFITKPINFEDLALTMEKTIKHVIQLRETLKAIKENNILKMYVDETVLNFMGGREFESSLMVNETVQATVAFIDICSFTSISENAAADTVVKLLNKDRKSTRLNSSHT